VDFGLLDKDGNILGLPYSYRDHITDGVIDDYTSNVMNADMLYGITGIQFMKFNSLFQLYAIINKNNTLFSNASVLLFTPDLLNYLFTGEICTEYTIASTSQMIDAVKKTWSEEIFKATGINKNIVTKIVQPGTIIGNISQDIADTIKLPPIPVIAVAEHDTASAIAAIPAQRENWAYLSSGTWSLMGIEVNEPIISDKAREYGFTNEGGVNGTIRFLKNISGMWLLEQSKKTWDCNQKYSYEDLINLAEKAAPFESFLDPDAPEFANPPDMVVAIFDFCRNTGQRVPQSIGQTVRLIFESLAMKYRHTMELLKEFSPNPIEVLHVIGGGCKNEMLNQFTANAIGIPVIAGPAEATALGNIMVQALAMKKVDSLAEIRKIIFNSTELKKYTPEDSMEWDRAYPEFLKVLFGEKPNK
jgi:rhamnulokinase